MMRLYCLGSPSRNRQSVQLQEEICEPYFCINWGHKWFSRHKKKINWCYLFSIVGIYIEIRKKKVNFVQKLM